MERCDQRDPSGDPMDRRIREGQAGGGGGGGASLGLRGCQQATGRQACSTVRWRFDR